MYSIERIKATLNTTPLATYSGYSYRIIEDRWRNDPLSAIGALENTAIQEQLGLKLVSTKAPIQVMVIDHVETPSEN